MRTLKEANQRQLRDLVLGLRVGKVKVVKGVLTTRQTPGKTLDKHIHQDLFFLSFHFVFGLALISFSVLFFYVPYSTFLNWMMSLMPF